MERGSNETESQESYVSNQHTDKPQYNLITNNFCLLTISLITNKFW